MVDVIVLVVFSTFFSTPVSDDVHFLDPCREQLVLARDRGQDRILRCITKKADQFLDLSVDVNWFVVGYCGFCIVRASIFQCILFCRTSTKSVTEASGYVQGLAFSLKIVLALRRSL